MHRLEQHKHVYNLKLRHSGRIIGTTKGDFMWLTRQELCEYSTVVTQEKRKTNEGDERVIVIHVHTMTVE